MRSYDISKSRWKAWAKNQQKTFNGKLNIQLVTIPTKGHQLGVVAREHIKKNTDIAVYIVEVLKENTYTSPLGDTYNIGVCDAKGNHIPDRIGMLTLPCLVDDLYLGLPRWGAFFNEPSPKESVNVEVKFDSIHSLKAPGRKGKATLQVAKMRTTRAVKPGEELVWCYGDEYVRDYPTSCEGKQKQKQNQKQKRPNPKQKQKQLPNGTSKATAIVLD